MRATLILTIACILLLVPYAAAQTTDTGIITPGAGEYTGNEPNVVAEVCLGTNDPSDCAADANGIDVALEGGAPTRILSVRLGGGTFPNNLVTTFAGGDDFLVGDSGFQAFYGMWSDYNGDGIIDFADPSYGDPRFIVNADVSGRHSDCALSPTVNPGGNDGQRISVDDGLDEDDDEDNVIIGPGEEANTGISNRCDSAQEFVGIAGKRVVVYVTPGDFNDWVNGPLGYEALGTVTPGATQPDFILGDQSNPDDTQGASDGQYFGPSAGFPQIWTDNGLLQSTLTEGIAEPDFTPASARAYNANNGQSVDVDLYKAVNPALETLYANSLGGIWYSPAVAGFNPDGGWAPAAQRDAILTLAGPAIGTTYASMVPSAAQDFPDGLGISEYTGQFGPYMNVFLNSAVSFFPGVGLAADADSIYTKGSMYFAAYGHIGGWWDKNGDGWIGTANADACGPHACGAVQDPNRYFTAKSNGEFFESAAYNNDAEAYYAFAVTLTPQSPGEVWGDTGIYVFADQYRMSTATGHAGPEYRDWDPANDQFNHGSNQYSFNPWDDIAYRAVCFTRMQAQGTDPVVQKQCDKATSPTALVASGPVVNHLVATTYSGTPYYSGYEHYILPGGNAGYAIKVQTEPVKYDTAGTILLVDTDIIPPA